MAEKTADDFNFTVTVKHLTDKLSTMTKTDPVVIKCGEKPYSVLGYKTTINLLERKRRLVIVTGEIFIDTIGQIDEKPEPQYLDLSSEH